MDLEGNSNSQTSTAFLEQLRQRHSGPLNVIWDNAPAHRSEAVREYLRTPGLGLRLMNPRFHEGRLCRATARTSTPMRPSGAGRERACPRENGGSHRKPVPGNQGPGKGEGWEFPLRAVHPERRGQGPLPHRPAIKGRRLSARIPAQSPMYCKCTSHLGFGLVLQRRIGAPLQEAFVPQGMVRRSVSVHYEGIGVVASVLSTISRCNPNRGINIGLF